MGNRPSMDDALTPNPSSAPRIMSIGRLSSVPVPVRVNSFSDKAAMAENNLAPNPDSPQSSISHNGLKPASMLTLPSDLSIFAPRHSAIFIAAIESAQYEGLYKVVVPSANNAAATALCMELFEAGASSFPPLLFPETFMIIFAAT
jgi:hypothetical protein